MPARRHVPTSWGCLVLAAATVVSSTSVPTRADTLLYYDLSSIPSVIIASATATTVADGIAATFLTRGPGVSGTNLAQGFSTTNWATTTASYANAVTTGQYLQFGFTVSASSTASLSQLDVTLRRSAVNAPMNYTWQYSLDGFATPGITVSDTASPYYTTGTFTYLGRSSTSGTTPTASNYNYMTVDVNSQDAGNAMPTLDLSAIASLQGMTEGSAVTFRLYAWGSGAGATTNTVAMGRNVGPRLTGTVSVPEPSGSMMLALGVTSAGGFWVYRRRRDASARDTAS